jgi:hypothetical protein
MCHVELLAGWCGCLMTVADCAADVGKEVFLYAQMVIEDTS